MRPLIFGVLIAATLPAHAQSTEQIFQSAITREGNSCPAVTNAQAIGTDESGNALVAVACSNGDRHVVKIHGNNSVSYVSSCGLFESYTDAQCFGGR